MSEPWWIFNQNHRNIENTKLVNVKVVNHHQHSTLTEYEPKRSIIKVVWLIQLNPLSEPRLGPAYPGKHSHSLLFFLFRPPTFQTAPFGLKIWGRQLTTNPKNFQGGGFAYIYYFRIIRGEMYRALTRQTHNFYLHLWKLGKEKTLLFTSLKVFVVFDSTKVCWKQQKQNKQTLSFILHQKSSKSIY